MKKLFIAVTLITAPFAASAQATFADNAPSVTNYLGFTNGSTDALQIRNGNAPIQFYTQNSLRMFLGNNGRLWLNTGIIGQTTFGIRPMDRHGLNILPWGATTVANHYSARFSSQNATQRNFGAHADINSAIPARFNMGFYGQTRGGVPLNIAVRGLAGDGFVSATNGQPGNIGVLGTAYESGGGLIGINYGVRGEACGGRTNIGVYGTITPLADTAFTCGTGGATNYAGYFAGPLIGSQPDINPSDENLKSDIQDITNARNILSQLQAKTYYFNLEQYGFMGLPEGKQFGLISQHVEEVLPELVKQYIHPAQYSLDAEMISEEVTVKGLVYQQLIPILVAGVNELNETIEAKDSQISELQEKLQSQSEKLAALQQQMASMLTVVQAMQAKTNSCCNDGSTGSLLAPNNTTEGVKLLQNTPNPFDTHTRVDFTLPTDAYVVLELSDAQGRPLRRLVDGQMNAGPQSIMLDGNSLAPGMYFYTVYANGEFITKKMVKR